MLGVYRKVTAAASGNGLLCLPSLAREVCGRRQGGAYVLLVVVELDDVTHAEMIA